MKNAIKGKMSGAKVLFKLNAATAQLAASARIIPAAVANTPKNKYSSAVIVSICFRFAPSVLSKTLSLRRCPLLLITADNKTIHPVAMLNPAIKRITKLILFNRSLSTCSTNPKLIIETLGKFLTTAP
ncbi:hypothetical protein D3C71_1714330 [compost metagenome]